jgi:hypothetical protein
MSNASWSWGKLLPNLDDDDDDDDFQGFSNKPEITDLVTVLKWYEIVDKGNVNSCEVRCVYPASSMCLMQTL